MYARPVSEVAGAVGRLICVFVAESGMFGLMQGISSSYALRGGRTGAHVGTSRNSVLTDRGRLCGQVRLCLPAMECAHLGRR